MYSCVRHIQYLCPKKIFNFISFYPFSLVQKSEYNKEALYLEFFIHFFLRGKSPKVFSNTILLLASPSTVTKNWTAPHFRFSSFSDSSVASSIKFEWNKICVCQKYLSHGAELNWSTVRGWKSSRSSRSSREKKNSPGTNRCTKQFCVNFCELTAILVFVSVLRYIDGWGWG